MNQSLAVQALSTLVLGALGLHEAHAAVAVDLQVPGIEFESTPYTLGFEFTVTSSVQLISLGIYDRGQDGLEAAGAVALWLASGGAPLVNAVVPVGTVGKLEGLFRYTAIVPLTLEPGVHYVIGAFSDGGVATSLGLGQGGSGSFDPRIVGISDRYNTDFMLWFPDASDGSSGAWLGANFQLAPVPEPQPAAMLAAALAMAQFYRLSRRRVIKA